MIKDFSKYQKVIEQFRGEVSKSNFDAKFSSVAKAIPKTEKFLLKMELKRLAGPCTRLIDLRGLVDGECRTFEYDGKTHFLDELAIKSFEENIDYYGSYTFGVYEAVKNTKNNFRVIYQNEKSGIQAVKTLGDDKKILEKMQYPAKFYQFGRYHNRKEERMNFAIPLLVTLDNNDVIESTSSDISINGCKFRFKSEIKLVIGQSIRLRYTGLEQEFQFGEDSNFSYQVRSVIADDSNQLIGVKRLIKQKNDSFSQFLDGFIQGNKRRYKINLDNTIDALQARMLEQFVLPKSNELPVFIDQTNEELLPRYVLTTNNNQGIFQYWKDEKHRSTLHYLLKKERVTYLKTSLLTAKTLIVYSFVHHNKGQSFFYTADEQELKNNAKFASEFLGFAASKSSFTVSELSYLPIDVENADSFYTLSNTLTQKNQYLNLPLSEDVYSTLENLPGIIVIKDITHSTMVAEYQSLSFDNIDTSLLKQFGHKRSTTPLTIDELGIIYKNHRQELRFHYTTPAVIEAQGIQWQGSSHDFSTSGLKIELESSSVLKKGDVVNLNFPKLQKITSAFDLSQLPYEVMRINKKKTILNLRVYVKKHQHIGRSFFKLLIEKNKDKLTTDEYTNLIPGLPKALRTLYASKLATQSLVIQTSGSRYKIETITSSSTRSDLLAQMGQLSDRKSYYNLYPLLNNLQATSLFHSNLKRMISSDEPLTNVIYIAINHDVEKIDQAVTTKLASELSSANLKKMFISNALKKGSFFCIQTKLSRTNEPDMEYLNPELSYISSYAIHRGKQIEQEIWSVAGIVQLIDITKETLFRHQTIPLTS
ncbi:MAG: PilZ domain-containing protein [Colwellia sp.]|nr:PilZ domain-containing protein [Colwellia sp.]